METSQRLAAFVMCQRHQAQCVANNSATITIHAVVKPAANNGLTPVRKTSRSELFRPSAAIAMVIANAQS
jgi:hypothetical protein